MVNSSSFDAANNNATGGDRSGAKQARSTTQGHEAQTGSQSASPVTAVTATSCDSGSSRAAADHSPSPCVVAAAIESPTQQTNSGGDDTMAADDPETEEDKTRLCCSVPLEKLQGVVSTTTLDRGKSKPKLLCLFCERSFGSSNLRQKHVERVHSTKQNRRISGRRQNHLSATPCIHCDKMSNTEHTLNDLFKHMVADHPGKYFGCLPCEDRFITFLNLSDHNTMNHPEIKPELPPESEDRITRSRLKPKVEDPLSVQDDGEFKKPADVKKKKTSTMKASKVVVKRSRRLQAQMKETESEKRRTNRRMSKTCEPDASSSGTKLSDKSKPVSINPYPEFDHFYRIKKITDHSIDNLKISSLTFDDVFDKAFFNRIKCNIEDNLLHHIDGKLFKNEESESRISNFEKIGSQTVQSSSSENFGCELTLNAITPVMALSLNSQYGEDFESQIEYGSKPSKKKTTPVKKDEIHYKYFTRRKYQASILEQKENRDLSRLDMWTQLVIKERQQKIINDQKSAKEILEYTSGEEYKSKVKREELDRILDRRGPFEDLKEEISKKAAFDKLNSTSENAVSEEVFSVVRQIVNEIINKVLDCCEEERITVSADKQLYDDRLIPAFLNLRRTSSLPEEEIDKSDRIALICSSQETENFELPTNKIRAKDEAIELTGEWARSRIYICAACGNKFPSLKYLLEHKSAYHPNVWVQHYEFVGRQSELYRHLSIPGLGKMGVVEVGPLCKQWRRSAARACTKCRKQCNSLGELHRHVLECGGDWTWILARKKCKYRPFGAKSRKKRRGLIAKIRQKEKTDASDTEKKIYKKTYYGPRSKPSDAETIQRMLANLPAKRSRRSFVSLRDVIFKSRKHSQTTTAAPQSQDKSSDNNVSKKLKQNQRPANIPSNRRTLRSLNKVLSSTILDSSLIRVKRKIKMANEQKTARQKRKALENNVFENVESTLVKLTSSKKCPKNTEPLIVSSSNIQNKIARKRILTSRMNIKSFFPVKKRGSRRNGYENSSVESEILANPISLRHSRNITSIEKVKEARQGGGLKGLVRNLRKKNNSPTEEKTRPKLTRQQSKESVSSDKSTGKSNKSTGAKSKSVKDKSIEEESAQETPQKEKITPKTREKKCIKKIKPLEDQPKQCKPKSKNLKKKFQSIINNVRNLKLDVTTRTQDAQAISASASPETPINAHSIFLEKGVLERAESTAMTKALSTSLEAKEEGVMKENGVSVVTSLTDSKENPPVPEKMFNLEPGNEEQLQAKGELNFDKKIDPSPAFNMNTVLSINVDTPDKSKNSISPSLVSPNVKGKIRKPAKGLNDCIAMLTNKLQQKISPLPSDLGKSIEINEEKAEHPKSSAQSSSKPECILRIPSFKVTSPADESNEIALDLSKKSPENVRLAKIPDSNSVYFEPPQELQLSEFGSTLNKVIGDVIEHKCKEVLSEKLTSHGWTSVNDIIQKVINSESKNLSRKGTGLIFPKNNVDDSIESVVKQFSLEQDLLPFAVNSRVKKKSSKICRKNAAPAKESSCIVSEITLTSLLQDGEALLKTPKTPVPQFVRPSIEPLKQVLEISTLPSATEDDDEMDIERLIPETKLQRIIPNLNDPQVKTDVIVVETRTSLRGSVTSKNDEKLTGGVPEIVRKPESTLEGVNKTDINSGNDSVTPDATLANEQSESTVHSSSESSKVLEAVKIPPNSFKSKRGLKKTKQPLPNPNCSVDKPLRSKIGGKGQRGAKALVSETDTTTVSDLNRVRSLRSTRRTRKGSRDVSSNEDRLADSSDNPSKESNEDQIKNASEDDKNCQQGVTSLSKEKIEETDSDDELPLVNLTQQDVVKDSDLSKPTTGKVIDEIVSKIDEVVKNTEDTSNNKISFSIHKQKLKMKRRNKFNGRMRRSRMKKAKKTKSNENNGSLAPNLTKTDLHSDSELLTSSLSSEEKMLSNPLQSSTPILTSKTHTRRKSKSMKKIDKVDNELFKDFALVINKKTKRIPPTNIVDDSVFDDNFQSMSKIPDSVSKKSDGQEDSLQEMDMELEEMTFDSAIVVRDLNIDISLSLKQQNAGILYDKITSKIQTNAPSILNTMPDPNTNHVMEEKGGLCEKSYNNLDLSVIDSTEANQNLFLTTKEVILKAEIGSDKKTFIGLEELENSPVESREQKSMWFCQKMFHDSSEQTANKNEEPTSFDVPNTAQNNTVVLSKILDETCTPATGKGRKSKSIYNYASDDLLEKSRNIEATALISDINLPSVYEKASSSDQIDDKIVQTHSKRMSRSANSHMLNNLDGSNEIVKELESDQSGDSFASNDILNGSPQVKQRCRKAKTSNKGDHFNERQIEIELRSKQEISKDNEFELPSPQRTTRGSKVRDVKTEASLATNKSNFPVELRDTKVDTSLENLDSLKCSKSDSDIQSKLEAKKLINEPTQDALSVETKNTSPCSKQKGEKAQKKSSNQNLPSKHCFQEEKIDNEVNIAVPRVNPRRRRTKVDSNQEDEAKAPVFDSVPYVKLSKSLPLAVETNSVGVDSMMADNLVPKIKLRNSEPADGVPCKTQKECTNSFSISKILEDLQVTPPQLNRRGRTARNTPSFADQENSKGPIISPKRRGRKPKIMQKPAEDLPNTKLDNSMKNEKKLRIEEDPKSIEEGLNDSGLNSFTPPFDIATPQVKRRGRKAKADESKYAIEVHDSHFKDKIGSRSRSKKSEQLQFDSSTISLNRNSQFLQESGLGNDSSISDVHTVETDEENKHEQEAIKPGGELERSNPLKLENSRKYDRSELDEGCDNIRGDADSYLDRSMEVTTFIDSKNIEVQPNQLPEKNTRLDSSSDSDLVIYRNIFEEIEEKPSRTRSKAKAILAEMSNPSHLSEPPKNHSVYDFEEDIQQNPENNIDKAITDIPIYKNIFKVQEKPSRTRSKFKGIADEAPPIENKVSQAPEQTKRSFRCRKKTKNSISTVDSVAIINNSSSSKSEHSATDKKSNSNDSINLSNVSEKETFINHISEGETSDVVNTTGAKKGCTQSEIEEPKDQSKMSETEESLGDVFTRDSTTFTQENIKSPLEKPIKARNKSIRRELKSRKRRNASNNQINDKEDSDINSDNESSSINKLDEIEKVNKPQSYNNSVLITREEISESDLDKQADAEVASLTGGNWNSLLQADLDDSRQSSLSDKAPSPVEARSPSLSPQPENPEVSKVVIDIVPVLNESSHIFDMIKDKHIPSEKQIATAKPLVVETLLVEPELSGETLEPKVPKLSMRELKKSKGLLVDEAEKCEKSVAVELAAVEDIFPETPEENNLPVLDVRIEVPKNKSKHNNKKHKKNKMAKVRENVLKLFNSNPDLDFDALKDSIAKITKPVMKNKRKSTDFVAEIEPLTEILTSSYMDIAPVIDEIDKSLEMDDIYDFDDDSEFIKNHINSRLEPSRRTSKRMAKVRALEHIHDEALAEFLEEGDESKFGKMKMEKGLAKAPRKFKAKTLITDLHDLHENDKTITDLHDLHENDKTIDTHLHSGIKSQIEENSCIEESRKIESLTPMKETEINAGFEQDSENTTLNKQGEGGSDVLLENADDIPINSSTENLSPVCDSVSTSRLDSEKSTAILNDHFSQESNSEETLWNRMFAVAKTQSEILKSPSKKIDCLGVSSEANKDDGLLNDVEKSFNINEKLDALKASTKNLQNKDSDLPAIDKSARKKPGRKSKKSMELEKTMRNEIELIENNPDLVESLKENQLASLTQSDNQKFPISGDKTDSSELRRSRRGSQKIISYNENDLIDPLIEAFERKCQSLHFKKDKISEPKSLDALDFNRPLLVANVGTPGYESVKSDLGDKIYEFTDSPGNEEKAGESISYLRKNKSKPQETASYSDAKLEKSEKFKVPVSSVYCDICKKTFQRIENLIKHRSTLTHISKLSEIEAKEAELMRNKEKEIVEQQNSLQSSENTDDINISDILESEKTLVSNKDQTSFSNNDTLQLADIINEVLNKPVEKSAECEKSKVDAYDPYNAESDSELETLKLKSKENYSPTLTKSIAEKQISLLENIIEKTGGNLLQAMFETCNPADSDEGTHENSHTFAKPDQYEEISEDSTSLSTYADQKARKILNRDEELFLECCSLLKSSSEVSDFSKHRKVQHSIQKRSDVIGPRQFVQPEEDAHEFCDNSRTPTPLGDTFDDNASGSNSKASEWNPQPFDKVGKNFTFKEALNGEPLLAVASRNDDVCDKDENTANSDEEDLIENRMDSGLGDIFPIENKKIITKGARKVFEGLKISIPTEDLDLNIIGRHNKEQSDENLIESPGKSKNRKSKPTKNTQVGSNVLFKAKKKKSPALHPETNDVYNFEETEETSELFTSSRQVADDKNNVENEIEPNDFEDLNGAEADLASNASSYSLLSTKKPDTIEENITKKKSKAMSKIFKNAAKSRMGEIEAEMRDIPEIPEIDNIELVENYVLSCSQQTEREPSTPSSVVNDREPTPTLDDTPKPKMTEQEMNQLFDQLLGKKPEEKPNKEAKVKKVKSDTCKKVDVKNGETKKKPQPKQKGRKRARSDSETDDEFNLNRSKKRPGKKKKEDNVINLEQELRECIGVASRKSQRSCTSGKQNVLVEYWSSDDEAFEAMLRAQNNKKPSKPVKKSLTKEELLSKEIEKSLNIVPTMDDSKENSVDKSVVEKPVEKKKPGRKKKVANNDSNKQVETQDELEPNKEALTAVNRRKRVASNPLYHWSSSSEDDESQSMVEITSVREDEEDDRPIQHGWIVGDSPKKLVTMLALTKGKKTDVDSVKEQNKKRTSAPS